MPGFTTHYLFGQQACLHLDNSDLKQLIQKYHAVYCLGLQGPDIFFYDILSAIFAKKNPGSTAHTADTGKFLSYLLESPRIFPTQEEKKIAGIYILGFVGHYLLDTKGHPYIYAMARYNCRNKDCIRQHVRLETDIDTALLWHYQHMLPSELRQNECILLSGTQKKIVAALLHFAFSRSYPGLHVTKGRILQAIRAMQLGTRLLYDPRGRKKSWLRRAESILPGHLALSPFLPGDGLIFHKDPCNAKHALWKNPWNAGLKSTESFFDLFEKALAQYVRLIRDIDALFAMEHMPKEESEAIARILSLLGNQCYHSGLSSAPYIL